MGDESPCSTANATTYRAQMLYTPFEVEWCIVGEVAVFSGRLDAIGPEGARLHADVVASPGDELRIDVRNESGSSVAIALARVATVLESGEMAIMFVTLGVDDTLLGTLAAASPRPIAKPPQLPGAKPGGPPPLRLDRAPKRGPRTMDEDDEPAPLIEQLAQKRTGTVIGIDLGTTNTCASYVTSDGRPQIIPGRTGTSTIPSMITFDPDGTFHIGQRAADRQIMYPTRTVYGSKRLLGRTFKADLAAELQTHFAYPLGEAEGQRFGARIDDRVISMDTIAARVLDEVRSSAEAYLKQPVEAAIITVPAYFTEVQRDAVRRAAAQAKLNVFRVVNEPTAAAVAYGHKQEKAARIAVWDFGGGTFDFSIVDVSDGQLEVIATGGDNFVGGSDFDDLVASHLLDEFQRIEGVTIEATAQQIARLREAAEKAKRMLGEDDVAIVEVMELTASPKRNLRVELTRETFDRLTAVLVRRTIAIATEVMRAADVSPKQIDDVLLVGGTTRILAVQKSVAELFGRRPSKRINPDEAVAIGAALLASEIGAGNAPALVDILPMSVGRGLSRRRFEPLAKRYTRVPARSELAIDADVLGTIYVPLFQGESPDVAQNEYLCTVIVEDRALWDRGRVLLRVSFDEHCVMAVEAIDARTGRPLPVKLDRSRPLEEVLADLGKFEGEEQETWRVPESTLGKALGKLFKMFGR
jgi:molecular chaperone DnaK